MKRLRVAILLGAISVLLLVGLWGSYEADKVEESSMSITAKSVIVDIADNWANATYLGVRSIDFWSSGTKITLADADFAAYATSEYSANEEAAHAFDTSLSKTSSSSNGWLSGASGNTNQRLIVVFNSEQTFDGIRINNYHSFGGSTDIGAKTVKIRSSTDTITDTTYNASITNSTLIFDSQFDEHIASNVEDEQSLTFAVNITADVDLPTLSLGDYSAYAYTGDNVGWGPLPAMEVESQAGPFLMDMEANIPVIEIEAHAGGSVDATLPDLESDATMSSTGIRTGDYFNDYTLTLPDLQITASFGERMSLDAKLPDLAGTGRTGSNAEGNLPELELTANCLVGQVATLDKKLPFPTLAASTGARLSKKLPLITINAEASTPIKLRLNKVLPTVGIEAAITGATGSLDKIIAFPKITATGSQDVTGYLDAKIPTMKISADALSGSICTLDATLPDLRIEAESNSAVIFLDAYLPTVTTGVASGSDYGSASNTISGDRFDGTLLRHERWA